MISSVDGRNQTARAIIYHPQDVRWKEAGGKGRNQESNQGTTFKLLPNEDQCSSYATVL